MLVIENDKCWMKSRCNKCDCDRYCPKLFKLCKLYDLSLIPLSKREHIVLKLDDEDEKLDGESYRKLSNISNDIENFIDKGLNLYIHSTNSGSGKTTWSLRLVESYLDKIWPKSAITCRVLFISVPRFLLALKDNISERSDYISFIKENVLSADLVIWDDIGTKSATVFEGENLLSIIDARMNNSKSNIFTSNLSESEVKQYLGERLTSRIVNNSINIEFKGKDKRGMYELEGNK